MEVDVIANFFKITGFLFFMTCSAFSADTKVIPPSAQIAKVHGEVLFNGKAVKLNEVIDKKGMLETKDKSFVKLKIEKWKNTISLGPNSKMEIDLSNEKKYVFEDGTCRWSTYEKTGESKGAVHTKYASMGVRGTDFTIKNTAILGETELYLFDGQVEFANANDVKDKVLVNKGQWVGIGGRFGEKVSKVIDIPKPLLKVLEADLKD